MNQNQTEIAYILDRSGSMSHLTEAAITGFNSFLDDQLDTPGDANFTLALFDNEYILHSNRAPLAEVKKLDTRSYVPRGTTALLDAIGTTIDNIGKKLSETPEPERPAKVIIAIYTDGYENDSKNYSSSKINQMIKLQTEKYEWDFLFLAANEDAMHTAAEYGISQANSSVVQFSEVGMESSTASISRKIKAQRKASMNMATESELQDLQADMSHLVKEEQNSRES